ncbi:3-hydroxyacyl-CoA dehydrogenase NAD-binding domain-containing protein [Desulfopila sp. IMCC35008]|uniref:3-hydroxyacyl-CoA dehydrogenase NAD-binding domain-containing protein n=1 Tax=Desulfopila sp. IMCC35008 TaxID=2653858 RepID=UPI0013D72F38|nr:3-hydroxyacyl-CoA dehydrogenase NAD-binding domain-containing protein [Desulfopila sp. IMCC35008]
MSQETVAVVGAGVIGCSYAASFAAKGYRVRIFDVRDDYESIVRKMLRTQLSEIPSTDVDVAMERVSCLKTLEEAVKDADMVQENGPETVDFKQTMYTALEKFCDSETLFASSSSGITPEVIGAKMKSPERAMIGHPFNPPHVLPIVEVCAVPDAPDELVARLMDFYERAGRVAVRLKKPIDGFVTNRLQYVFQREAIHLVKEGVVDMEGLDKIVMASLGVRWACVGPFLAGQLGGGDGGMRGLLENIFARLDEPMGLQPLSTETLEMIEEQGGKSYPLNKSGEFAMVRDKRQLSVLEALEKNPLPKAD